MVNNLVAVFNPIGVILSNPSVPQVYLSMSADVIYPGYVSIIKKAANLGEVTVGLLTGSAIASYELLPFMSFELAL